MAVYQLPPLDFRVVSPPSQLCQWDSLRSPKHVKPSWVVPSHIGPTNAHAFKLHTMMIYVSHIVSIMAIPSFPLYVIVLFGMPFLGRGGQNQHIVRFMICNTNPHLQWLKCGEKTTCLLTKRLHKYFFDSDSGKLDLPLTTMQANHYHWG